MNQGRIWCVVSPNVGLPLLLGSVAATSLIVHAVILTNTTWYPNYYQGSARARVSEAKPAGEAKAVAQNATGGAVTVTVKPSAADATAFEVTVTPSHAVATAVKAPDKAPGPLALATPTR